MKLNLNFNKKTKSMMNLTEQSQYDKAKKLNTSLTKAEFLEKRQKALSRNAGERVPIVILNGSATSVVSPGDMSEIFNANKECDNRDD